MWLVLDACVYVYMYSKGEQKNFALLVSTIGLCGGWLWWFSFFFLLLLLFRVGYVLKMWLVRVFFSFDEKILAGLCGN